ncbi:uncharacterized protein LOC117567925 [Drosophila albomicans]|uniref:Uncharacterized protein LOC117567925 n=1 Tax=Drosophila albomicans TaxID=7291 RepID=A0A6P8WKB9_DROAB|nr:uncharacterized protein LOC117567925 [Drosophila albomicans]
MSDTIRLLLSLGLYQICYPVQGNTAKIGHYSQSLIDSIVDLYMGNSSTFNNMNKANSTYKVNDSSVLVPAYILLILWIICIVIIICCCLYCKCKQAEMMTSYTSNNFELQEVHVMDHPLPHVKGCVCLCCLQQQLAKEMQLKREC